MTSYIKIFIISFLLLVSIDFYGQKTPKNILELFDKQDVELLKSLDQILSDPWEISLDTIIYPEGLNLPAINMTCYNKKTDEGGYNIGTSILFFNKMEKEKIKNFFNNEMTKFYFTRSFIVVVTHGYSFPFEEFAKKEINKKYMTSFNKMTNELEDFFIDNKRQL